MKPALATLTQGRTDAFAVILEPYEISARQHPQAAVSTGL